eukprot:463760-Amphidinium_carterae.1
MGVVHWEDDKYFAISDTGASNFTLPLSMMPEHAKPSEVVQLQLQQAATGIPVSMCRDENFNEHIATPLDC